MKYQPSRDYKSDDVVMTPIPMAKLVVEHFKPTGKVLEPCKGTGNILKFLPQDSDWCEISEGKDFYSYEKKVDWIITNPPWSQMRKFLQKSMEVADNIVFIVTVNHFWTKARLRDMRDKDFSFKEILLLDTPKDFPQSGFQLGAVYIKKGYEGMTKVLSLLSE